MGAVDAVDSVDIVYARPPGPGWAPLDHLADLASRYFSAPLTTLTVSRRGAIAREALSRLPRAPRKGRGVALLIAPQPQHLRAMVGLGWLLGRYATTAAWVIDSFWPERIPAFARRGRAIDQYFVADHEYVDVWRRATGTTVTWLPWGSDVVGLGSAATDRPVDLQRLGRQPLPWERDEDVARALSPRGITYAGRPPMLPDPAANHRLVTDALGSAKFALAFGNGAAPSATTHPTHEYLTARWTDALACGAAVVGVPPSCHATREILWPHALVRLPGTALEDNLEVVQAAVAAWSPADPVAHVRTSLERLDWRLRLEVIAHRLGVDNGAVEAGRADLAAARARLAPMTRTSPLEDL